MLMPTHRQRLLALLPDRFLHTEDFSCDANLGSDLVRPRLADHRLVLFTSVRGLLLKNIQVERQNRNLKEKCAWEIL